VAPHDVVTAALARKRTRQQLPEGPMARYLRRRAGLTLSEVGEVVGATGVAVSLWERGLRRPRDPRLVAAYAALLDRLAREVANGR
jgi:transcriptional regulator with XRE-family HTH domain